MLTVVYGPPCSGKSTYVRTHAAPGDIIIDFDVLAKALGSPSLHDHSGDIRHVAIAARRAAIEAALTIHHRTPVWIIDGSPPPDRIVAYKNAGARFVGVDADRGELHRRAAKERPKLWHRLIDEWEPPEALMSLQSRDW